MAVWGYNGGMKKTLALLSALLAFGLAFAQETGSQSEGALEEKLAPSASPHNFMIYTDFAYYPKSAAVAASGERFAPITGPYDGLQAGVTGCYDYTIPIPGSNALTKGNNIKLGAEFQISPATLKPRIFMSWTPAAFLVFDGGMTLGTGWNFMGAQGLASYNPASGEYDDLTPFKNCFYEFDLGATFQFDAAALWPGDWHHIVFMSTYRLRYSGMTNQADGHPWCWAADYNRVNGPNYYVNIILGYQMPFKLSMAGAQLELDGYYSDRQFAEQYRSVDGDFCRVNISPMLVFGLTKKDTLFVLLYFERRRGFDAEQGYVNGREQNWLEMNCSGGEWYFKRLAFRYIHKF